MSKSLCLIIERVFEQLFKHLDKRSCERCGKHFKTRYKQQRFCCKAHRKCLSKETKEQRKTREKAITLILSNQGKINDYSNRARIRAKIRSRVVRSS